MAAFRDRLIAIERQQWGAKLPFKQHYGFDESSSATPNKAAAIIGLQSKRWREKCQNYASFD
jgi:hypothetical protein